MKNILTLILAFACVIPLSAQDENQSLYQHKVEVYTRMKNTGWTMTGFGAGLMVTGTVLLASLPSDYWLVEDTGYYYEEDYSTDDEIKAFGGIMCLGLGVGLLAGGITLGSIGTKKVRQYQSKLDNLSFTPVITPKVQGFALVYKF